jgi:hypothetical protein
MNLQARKAPLLLFLLGYLGYSASLLGLRPRTVMVELISVAFLGVMVTSVIWAQRRQDEVLRSVTARANAVGFWAGFATLYLSAVFAGSPPVRDRWPFWTVPLIVWVVAYGWSLWRLR